MKQRELFANPEMDNPAYIEYVASILQSEAVSLCDMIANNLSLKTLKQRVRPYTSREILTEKYKNRTFLFLTPKHGKKKTPALQEAYSKICEKYMAENLYKHEGNYEER